MPRDRCARCPPVIRYCFLVIACVSCISYHVIMCISFAYMFVSCIRVFSPLSVLQFGAPMSSGVPLYLFSCAGIKHWRIGPRLVMRPWFTTGRPPVKFRAIWTSFDTPTVNWGTVKPLLCAAQHPSQTALEPIQTPSMLSVVRSRSRGRKPHLIWTLLTPSTYKYVTPSEILAQI